MLDRIEDFHNRISDTDFVWFPFLGLKLKPDQVLSFSHRLKMTIAFGLYGGVANLLRKLIMSQPTSIELILMTIAKATIFFFLWFNLVTAYFWNRRAQRERLERPSTPNP